MYETNVENENELDKYMPGYKHIGIKHQRRSKFGRNPGGISVFIRNNIFQIIDHIQTTENFIAFHISKGRIDAKADLIILFVYIFPESSKYYDGKIERNGL